MKQITTAILAILFAIALVSSGISACADGWVDAYSGVLDALDAEKPADAAENPAFESVYLLYDIDKDGVPELITKTGTCEADYLGTVYAFRDGKAVKTGEFGMGHAALYSDPGENGILLYWGHMGAAGCTRYSLKNGELTSEVIFEETLDIMNDPTAEYTPVEEFMPSAKPLSLYASDLRLPLPIYEEILDTLTSEQ